MFAHSSILVWRIPWTEETDWLPWGHKKLDMTEQLSARARARAHTHTHIHTAMQEVYPLDL